MAQQWRACLERERAKTQEVVGSNTVRFLASFLFLSLSSVWLLR